MSLKKYNLKVVESNEFSNKNGVEVIQMDSESIAMNKVMSQTSPSQVLQQKSSFRQSLQSSEILTQEVDKIDLLDWDNLNVKVRNLKFSYQRSKPDALLKDVNMSIPKSSIYGLLGPSGCGKTTLLRLIIGRLKPKSGSVLINGKKPGDSNNIIPGIGVGFMPQEIALYEEFTINEALKYFARIYAMKEEQVNMRIKFLVDFLQLPKPERKIQFLSGGQKRRVSLALALVHSPPLLILDEPTVGVDPLLRERIWEHLVVLSNKESISILITTHYIEEARRAHIVSLMRGGKLLVEHSPNFLLKYFEVQNLEDVFLKICRFDSKETDYAMPNNYIDSRPHKKPSEQNISSNNSMPSSQDLSAIKMNNSRNNLIESEEAVNKKIMKDKFSEPSGWSKLLALLHKGYIRIIRNKPLLAFHLVLPTIQIILFCLCIGAQPHNLKLAVYNQEPNTTKFYRTPFSALFLQQIDNKTITLKNYDSDVSALDSVKQSDTFGVLMFHKQFTDAIVSRFMSAIQCMAISDQDINDQYINNGTILYHGDFSDLMISQTIVKALLKAEEKFLHVLLNISGKNPRTADTLVQFVDPPVYGTLDPSFRDFMVPGMILAITYILAVGLTALSIVIERKEGLLERTVVAGVKIYQILISQIILQLILLCFQSLLVMLCIFLVFNVPNKGSYFMIVLITLMQGMTGMSFGLVISSICNDEQSAVMLSLGSFYPYLVISGIMWPLEGMPFGLRQFSYFLPQTLSIISLRNIMLKGWDISHTYVYLGYLSTIAWIVIFLLTATLISSIRNR